MANEKSLSALSEALEKAAMYDALKEELGEKLSKELSKAVLGMRNSPAVRKLIEQKALQVMDEFLENYDFTNDEKLMDNIYNAVGNVIRTRFGIKPNVR